MTDTLKYLKQRLENEKRLPDAIFCTIEEMSEVTKVLTKFLRASRKFSRDDLTEEIAHALMMLTAIKNMFEIPDENIEREQLKSLQKFFGIE